MLSFRDKNLNYYHHSVSQLLLRECDAAINYCRDNLDKGTKGEKLVGCYHSSHSEGILLPLLILGSQAPQVDKTILDTVILSYAYMLLNHM